MKKIIFYIVFVLLSFNSHAFELKNEFFVSLRSDEVNLRTGPGSEYPIKYTYQLKDMPLKVLGEYENWYQVIDKDNDKGWLNKNLTTKRRTLIVINGTQIIYKKDDINSNPIFRIEKNVILKYEKCNSEWCKIEINDKTGWIQANNVWGMD